MCSIILSLDYGSLKEDLIYKILSNMCLILGNNLIAKYLFFNRILIIVKYYEMFVKY